MDEDSKNADGSNPTRRSVLQTLAASSVGLTGVGVASATPESGNSQKQAKMRERFSDDAEVVDAIEPTVPSLMIKLKSRGQIPETANPSVESLVRRSRISVVVAPIGGQEVTHVQVSPEGLDVEFVHQLENERTSVTFKSGGDSETYATTYSDDSVTKLGCFVTDECCGGELSCTAPDNVNYYYTYKKECCGSSLDDCYWYRTDDCCTSGNCFL